MNASSFSMHEFMKPASNPEAEAEVTTPVETSETAEAVAPELDVQKAVVESLAADKAELDHQLEKLTARATTQESELAVLKQTVEQKDGEVSELAKALSAKEEELNALKEALAKKESELAAKTSELARKESELAAEMEKKLDLQERNPNALALLDREIELPDRFPGETRDHVLEVITEARAAAEAEGRVRKAQVLEAVLMANEPNGTLAKRRSDLQKVFNDNANVINGKVLEFLKENGIAHKNGEEYLLPSEILKRSY